MQKNISEKIKKLKTMFRIFRYPLLLIVSIIAFVYGFSIGSYILILLSMTTMFILFVDVIPARIVELNSYRKFRKTKGFLLAKELFLENINSAELDDGNESLSFTIYDDIYVKIFEIKYRKRTPFMFSKINVFEINGVDVYVPFLFEREMVTTAEKKLKELRYELKIEHGGFCDDEVIEFERKMRRTEKSLDINNWNKF